MKNTPENITKQKKLNSEVEPKLKHAAKRSGAALNYVEPKAAKRSDTPTGHKKESQEENVRSRSNSDASIHSVKSNVSSSSSKSKTPLSKKALSEVQSSKNKKAKSGRYTPQVSFCLFSTHFKSLFYKKVLLITGLLIRRFFVRIRINPTIQKITPIL